MAHFGASVLPTAELDLICMAKAKPPIRTEIMSGWKDIAAYLGKGVRTVQRYERDAGLPVRRSVGNAGSVIATQAELDAWVDARPLRQTFKLSRTLPETYFANFAAFKKTIEEHRQLRREMTSLRDELHRSVELLRESRRFVKGEGDDEDTKIRRYEEGARGQLS